MNKKENYVIFFASLIITIGIIWVVKNYLLPSISISSDSPQKIITWLEVVAVSIIFAAFLFSEILVGLHYIFHKFVSARKGNDPYHSHISPVFVVLVAFASMIIYSALILKLEPDNPPNLTEPEQKSPPIVPHNTFSL